MTKIIYSLLFILATAVVYSQESAPTKEQMKMKLDSILKEANTIYNYERAAWVATDLARANKELKNFSGRMVIYPKGGWMIACMLDEKENSLAEYGFDASFVNPELRIEKRGLSKEEQQLFKIKDVILAQLSDKKYGVGAPEGFALNAVLLPKEVGYKLYIITGTSQSKVIPFGNDYLFETDSEGKIENWKRFHSRLIPAQTEVPGGGAVVRLTHSHLKTTPLISATDICTFKLYAPLYDLEEFSVYASGTYFLYRLKNDSLTVEEQ